VKTEAGQQSLQPVHPRQIRVTSNVIIGQKVRILLIEMKHLSRIVHLLFMFAHLVPFKSISQLWVCILHLYELSFLFVLYWAARDVNLELVRVESELFTLT
jgi:hypothetical protein